jgi:hypothetical protein
MTDSAQLMLRETLQDILQALQRIEQALWRATPPYSPAYPTMPIAPSVCPKCSMVLDGVTGYVCGAPDCPTFAKITCGSF